MPKIDLVVEMTSENIRGFVINIKEYQWMFKIACK